MLRPSIIDLPMKTAVYGTLVGLLNARQYHSCGSLVRETTIAMQEALENGKWRDVKLLARFFAELVNANVILPTAFLDAMNDLLGVLDEMNVNQVSILLLQFCCILLS